MELPVNLQEAPSIFSKTIGSFSLPGGGAFSPTYFQAAIVLVAVFVFILAFAMFQRRQHQENIKNTIPSVAFGFALALVLEAVLLIGGRTMFTELLGWKDAPKPISNALDASRNRLVDVLGVTEAVPESKANTPATVDEIVKDYESLKSSEKESLQTLICPSE